MALLFGWFLYENSRPIDLADLAERVSACNPGWANYQEDIKGQIGAKAVAQWNGNPVHASQAEGTLQIAFTIEGPWEHYALALPVLMRDPFGNEVRNSTAVIDGPGVSYEFDLSATSLNAALPWIELQYPHTSRRLTFSSDGSWKARH